jgi:hypothetical protein
MEGSKGSNLKHASALLRKMKELRYFESSTSSEAGFNYTHRAASTPGTCCTKYSIGTFCKATSEAILINAPKYLTVFQPWDSFLVSIATCDTLLQKGPAPKKTLKSNRRIKSTESLRFGLDSSNSLFHRESPIWPTGKTSKSTPR